ncbi:SRPBCC family protein [Cellulomonas sp. NPDC089187]|uniref:SRPBCC family protein n=1 Tax=Cellulomonas sp. NPDC089187 TaxID=3154970 RepID=UPI003440E02E
MPQPTPPDYRLITRWTLPAEPDRVWAVLADPDLTWPRWWPGLIADWSTPDRAGFTLRPSRWAYALRFTLAIEHRDAPSHATLRVAGDLVGTGLVHIAPTAEGSTLELDWQVRTTRAWMIRTAPLLAPMFRLAHTHAMNRGERGLREFLRAHPAA